MVGNLYFSTLGIFNSSNTIQKFTIDNTLNPNTSYNIYTTDMNGNTYLYYSMKAGGLEQDLVAFIPQSFSTDQSMSNSITTNNVNLSIYIVINQSGNLAFSS